LSDAKSHEAGSTLIQPGFWIPRATYGGEDAFANEKFPLMDSWVVDRLIDWAAGKKASKTTRESVEDELAQRASEFAVLNASPMEKVLAETVAINWFALRLHEAQYASQSTSEDRLTIKQADFQLRRIDRAHRRLMRTLRALATVRRLALHALQINRASQQVNQVNVGDSA
jgi:hypothetical protein